LKDNGVILNKACFNKGIKLSFQIVFFSIVIPFKKISEDTFLFGYPLGFITAHVKALSQASLGFKGSILQYLNINVITLFVNVVCIYLLLKLIQRIKKNLKRKVNRHEEIFD